MEIVLHPRVTPISGSWVPATYQSAERDAAMLGWHRVRLANGEVQLVPRRRLRAAPLVHVDQREGDPMPTCARCDAGFRRVDGIHVGSQRSGMIPHEPCRRIFATHDATGWPRRRDHWLAFVDGELLRGEDGEARHFASALAAYDAARVASPRLWHP